MYTMESSNASYSSSCTIYPELQCRQCIPWKAAMPAIVGVSQVYIFSVSVKHFREKISVTLWSTNMFGFPTALYCASTLLPLKPAIQCHRQWHFNEEHFPSNFLYM